MPTGFALPLRTVPKSLPDDFHAYLIEQASPPSTPALQQNLGNVIFFKLSIVPCQQNYSSTSNKNAM